MDARRLYVPRVRDCPDRRLLWSDAWASTTRNIQDTVAPVTDFAATSLRNAAAPLPATARPAQQAWNAVAPGAMQAASSTIAPQASDDAQITSPTRATRAPARASTGSRASGSSPPRWAAASRCCPSWRAPSKRSRVARPRQPRPHVRRVRQLARGRVLQLPQGQRGHLNERPHAARARAAARGMYGGPEAEIGRFLEENFE